MGRKKLGVLCGFLLFGIYVFAQPECNEVAPSYAHPNGKDEVLYRWSGGGTAKLGAAGADFLVEVTSSIRLRSWTENQVHYFTRSGRASDSDSNRHEITKFVDPLIIEFKPIADGQSTRYLRAEFFHLKLKGRWLSSTEVFDVPSTDKYTRWSEHPVAVHWLHIEVPSKGISVNDTLQLFAVNENGDQVVCLNVHL